jgi:hypothetical protein
VKVVELSDQTNSFTEFEIRYPVVVDGEEEIITKLSNLFLRFALINLHIAFSLQVPGMAIFDIPAVETMSEKWSNKISIWCYYEKDFEELIINLQNEEMVAYSILKEFREGTNISKSEASITIGELKNNKQEIKRLPIMRPQILYTCNTFYHVNLYIFYFERFYFMTELFLF